MPKPKPKQKKGSNDKAIVTPGDTDILFGRGGHVNHHRANQYYLELVCDRKDKYLKCKKVDKAGIAWGIIQELRAQDPDTRFLRKDYSTGLWHLVKDNEVRRKISQCLRERAAPVLPRKTRKSKKKDVKSAASKQKRSPRGLSQSDLQTKSQESPFESLPQDKSANENQPKECQVESFPQQATFTELNTPKASSDPLMKVQMLQERQESFRAHRIEKPVGQEYEEIFAEPPMPIPQPSRLETSARVWSDFLTGSFASFTPSIFDATGVESAWENLLDPSSLPQLCDDDESFPGSLTSDEASTDCASANRRSSQSTIETLPASNFPERDSECTQGGEVAYNNSPKRQPGTSREGSIIDPASVDSFFNCDVSSLGKVLEQSHLLRYASVDV